MNRTAINRSTQQFGSLRIDHEAHEVSLDGHPIHLTLSEFILLTTLAESPRRAFSNEYLTQILTRSDWVNENHALQVTVSRLRRKLGESGRQPRRVVTVHGYGYRFEPDAAPDLAVVHAADEMSLSSDPALQSAFILAALDRTILWASDSMKHLLGWQPTELQGKVLYELIHADDTPVASEARTDLDAGFPSAMVLHFQTASGDYRLVEALARPIIGSDGATISFLGEYRPATSGMLLNPEPIRLTPAISPDLG